MKIFQVITKPHMGGAQKHVLDILMSLKDDSFDVTLITGKDSYRPLIDICDNEKINYVEVPTLIRDIKIFGDIKSFFFLLNYLKLEKPDVVHLHSSKAGGIGALAARFSGVKKIIFTAHGTPFNEDRSILSRMSLYILSVLTVALSHKTICVSKAVYRSYPMFLRRKCRVIYNGIDSFEYLEKSISQKKLNVDENYISCGVIAELNKNKGLKYLVDAVSILSEENKLKIKVYIAGQGEDKKTLLDQIKKHDLENTVILLGHVHGVSKLLKAFDFIIMPSINEGLPYVLLEAGIARLPVIATSVGGIPEVIENQKTGILVEPKNSEQLASGISDFMEDPGGALGLGEKLYQKTLNEFSVEKMLIKIYLVYGITQDQETRC